MPQIYCVPPLNMKCGKFKINLSQPLGWNLKNCFACNECTLTGQVAFLKQTLSSALLQFTPPVEDWTSLRFGCLDLKEFGLTMMGRTTGLYLLFTSGMNRPTWDYYCKYDGISVCHTRVLSVGEGFFFFRRMSILKTVQTGGKILTHWLDFISESYPSLLQL